MKKRTNYLVGRTAQLKFIGLVILAFLVLLLFVLWNVHILLSTIMPSGILAASRRHIVTFAAGTVLIIIVTAAVIIKFTHRFFGPLPRLKAELKNMAEEDRYWLLRVRDGDFLSDFVDNINLIIAKLMK
jgi:hypothetical protein